MLVSKDSYMYEMIRTELTDILGDENVCTRDADKFGHSIDYYWIPEMWHDRGMETPKPDFIVHPGSAEEVSRVVKLANHYHITRNRKRADDFTGRGDDFQRHDHVFDFSPFRGEHARSPVCEESADCCAGDGR